MPSAIGGSLRSCVRVHVQVGGLDAQCDWSQLLSSGEQQRVAVLRLLAHAPQLAFLDEATSAVDGHLGKEGAPRQECMSDEARAAQEVQDVCTNLHTIEHTHTHLHTHT